MMKNGTVRLAPVTNIRLAWRTRAYFNFRPDHDTRRVAEMQGRNVMGVAQLHEPRALVGTVQVDGPAKIFPVIG